MPARQNSKVPKVILAALYEWITNWMFDFGGKYKQKERASSQNERKPSQTHP
jgi:hypothetical protein